MKMENRWKNLIIIVLSLALVANGAGNFILSFDSYPYWKFGGPPISTTLVVGIPVNPSDLDPINTDEGVSVDVLYQIVEGLYMHNLKDSNLEIVPRLAEDFGNWDLSGTHYTIPLRRNIIFHDGSPFNATVVKWNFERINWFINGTGKLNSTLSKNHCLWEFPNGTTILDSHNPITINNEYNVTINLRAPFAILEALLCHVSAFMVSPESTPKYEYIHPIYNRIVGTGPFVYENYVVDKEINFHRWDNYWRGLAFFESLHITIIEGHTKRNNAMLSHLIDYMIGWGRLFYPQYDDDLSIIHNYETLAISYNYLGMNNDNINKSWRQAISYAINYTHIIEQLAKGYAYRANSPISPTFPMFNPTIQPATYNLTKAREIVVGMGFGDIDWTDAQWRATSFIHFNYSYMIGSDFREDLVPVLQDNLEKIGISVYNVGLAFADFIPEWEPPPMPLEYYETRHLYWRQRFPNYLSPYHMLFQLFSNQSAINSCEYYNHTVELWLGEILRESNRTKRAELYSKILHQVVEIDMPHAFSHHYYQHFVHSADIQGVPYNALNRLYIYPMYRS